MTSDLMLRRKWTLRAHGKQVVFVKRANERSEHVLMKAFIWALYLPFYDNLMVEVRIGDRYKPDVVALDSLGTPVFWGESGRVGKEKIQKLVGRYQHTHFALAKWNTRLGPYEDMVRDAVSGLERTAPFDLICFNDADVERYINVRGNITISLDDVTRTRLS